VHSCARVTPVDGPTRERNLLPFRQDETAARDPDAKVEEAKYLIFGTKKDRQEDRVTKAYNTPLIGGRDHRDHDARWRRARRRSPMSGNDGRLMVCPGSSQAIRFTVERPGDGPYARGTGYAHCAATDEVSRSTSRQGRRDLLVVTENG